MRSRIQTSPDDPLVESVFQYKRIQTPYSHSSPNVSGCSVSLHSHITLSCSKSTPPPSKHFPTLLPFHTLGMVLCLSSYSLNPYKILLWLNFYLSYLRFVTTSAPIFVSPELMDISGSNFKLVSNNRTFCYEALNTIIYTAQCLMLQRNVSILPSCFKCSLVEVSGYEVWSYSF